LNRYLEKGITDKDGLVAKIKRLDREMKGGRAGFSKQPTWERRFPALLDMGIGGSSPRN
jgi:hypothetical protein